MVRAPVPRLAIERFTLDNGIRVVLNPDRSVPAVGIAVSYDVGFRSEPEGRTGFAHLFEHLMFQGTANLAKGEADRLIEGNGGIMNGSTHPDFTNYLSQLPSNALELGLFLEAERMRGPRLDEVNLRNQIDVVKEEIRVNVMNQPYGRFPWIDLPPVMFDSFNNAHDGYGSFVDLESATLDDAASFFRQFYCPANAVLAIAGDVDPDTAYELAQRHFGDLVRRRRPKLPDCSEPLLDADRHGVSHDRLAPLPAVALAYRVPDPITQLREYVASVVLSEVLGGSEASRLYQRLVKRDRSATHVAAMLGTFGDPFEMRDPTMFQVLAYLPAGVGLTPVLEAVDEEIASLVDGPGPAQRLTDDEVSRAVTGLVSEHLRHLDHLLERAITIGVLEQQRGRAELVNELVAVLADVSPGEVVEAAGRWLAGRPRAVLEVVPGAAA